MGLDNCFGSFKLRVMFRTLFCYCLLISSLCGTVCCNYLNQFAVHVTGDPVESVRRADQIAAKHGFKNLGQVWEGDNYFLFEHHHIAKRSTNPSHHHHSLLSEDPEVRWFQQQYVKKRVKRDYIPVKLNDRLWRQQWYLNGGGHRGDDTHETYDMSVKGAWDMGYSGKGIVVTILDDGIERTHDDLKDNYDPQASYDVNGDDNDPMPKYDPTNENRHGTRCAGEVAAKANNSKCIVGAAFNARIGGVRMLDGEVSDVVEAKSLGYNRDHIDIYSASWGPDDDGKVVDGPGPLARKAFTDGIAKGRGGKGSVFVWASGNGGSAFDSCNCDGYTNSIYTLSISSTSEHGHKPWYLEECSSTLATTYSSGRFDEKQIVTTDLRNKCTTSHTGTSASAPLAAGLVALVLEANPSLTWRDVQYITLLAANPKPMADGEWITNGKNRQVSLRYGYGLMNATAMVEYALKWKNVPAKHICRVSTGVSDVKLMGTRYESKIHTDGCSRTGNEVKYLEHVQAQITLSYYRRGNLVIHLTSPSGTRSTLLPKRPSDMSRGGFNNWAFLSVHFWEEDPSGTWKLEIEDNHSETSWPKPPPSGARGTLKSWTLILHGTKTAPIDIKNEPYTKPATTTQKTTHVGSITTMTSNCHAECVSSCSGPGPEHCIECKHLRMGEHGACVTACPNGYRKSKNTCLPCDGSCELCTTHLDKAHCDKCKDGYFMLEGEGTCTVECPDGYFLGNSALKTCKKCNRECELCAERADKCTKCPSRMILQLNKCYLPQKMCDIGFYKDSRQNCQRCAWGCDFCDGPGRCVQCAKYSYMLNGACMRKCPKGYLAYVVKLAQSTVHNECRQCLTANCDSCSSHFALKNGQCEQIKSCQKTQYFDFTIMECKDCHWKCSSCQGPGSHQCLNCNSPLAYHSYLHTCLPCCRNGQKQTTCCNCNLNEGVCMLKPMEESQTNPKAVLVLVLVGITALLIVTVVTLIIKLVLYKKLVPSKELSYQKLRQQDDDKDFDGLIQDNI